MARLAQVLRVDLPPNALELSLAELGVDSLSTIEFVSLLEQELGVEIDIDAVTPDETLAVFLARVPQ